ncbi:8-amino-7-oxononanoate synthase [Pseudoxanthomonas jiangsuensis]|uniref:8-amino-7-oxononanoate synthase n=1 Tax=Pseudoxanthomonas jiangsuensis TaxID=619688 RepID=UPI001390D2F1|nr:8-amino-7-oxononanoate synthase [Pseudoxanthomonas jiangsuensis]KAF1693925.1 8-amino-7-oxononanoate synthase [Pseudoxanthomonas jiangsuensis]
MARTDIHERILAQRRLRTAQGRLRQRRTVARRDGVRLEVDGRWLTGFCSNDYLGLASQFEVGAALQDAAAREGAGSTASHLVCGHHALHEQLEREMADWLQVPRALLFGSGFAANLAVQQALLEDEDVCVQDRLTPASLIDATRLAGCRLRRYPHLDPEGAMRQLRNAPGGAAMLATDGVFSMDGDVAPLRALSLVARTQEALLYVDDAHGIGVLGPQGRGTVAEAGLGVREVPLQLATLGKALGGYGAVVAGDADLVEHLAGSARPYLYTTALPPAQAAASLAALKLARRDDWRRERLRELIEQFRTGAGRLGLDLMASSTPIQPVLCGDESVATAMSSSLEDAGFLVTAIRPPTVPEGRSRLRVTLSALHTPQQVQALLVAIADARERADRAAA